METANEKTDFFIDGQGNKLTMEKKEELEAELKFIQNKPFLVRSDLTRIGELNLALNLGRTPKSRKRRVGSYGQRFPKRR